jgi:uncharacterized protein
MPDYISQYVLKVAGRCDLACNHCYVYEHADQSWRVKPKFMTQAIARQVLLSGQLLVAPHGDRVCISKTGT